MDDRDLPICLQQMSPRSRDLLKEDVVRWGSEVAGLSYRQILGHTDLGTSRAERLHAWLHRFGLELPELESAPLQEELEVADEASEPPASPGVTVRQRSEGADLEVEAQGNDAHSSERDQGVVRNLEELMAQADIDPAQWTADDFQARTWATPMRRRRMGEGGVRLDDEISVVRSWYVSAKFRRRLDKVTSAADWGKRVPRRARAVTSPSVAAVIFPDMQLGYRWGRGHQVLEPLHDWAAIDAGLRLLQLVQPDVVQNLGDGLDFAAFSTKFPVALELRDTTRPSLLSMHALLRMQRELVRGAEIDYQGGNHEERSERALVGTEYDGLTRADAPDGPPVLSFASLLGLDALDITWRRYGEHRWLFDSVLVHHGDKVKSRGGLTAADVIRDAQSSVLFGHIHRLEQASRTIHGPAGVRTITAASPGCLCRVDGAVPGVTKRPDWQQGMGIVWWDAARKQDHLELIPIHDGILYFRGDRIEGDGVRLAAEVAEQIRYPQVARWAQEAA